MNRKLFLVTIFLPLTILGIAVSGQIIPRAHASGSGMVCIAQVTDTGCPPAGAGIPPVFNGPVTTPNSLLRVPIFINNTDPFLGFDITVNSSDVTKLKPFGADLTGSMMPMGSIVLSECVGTFNVTGGACPSTSNPSSLRFAVIGPFGFLSQPGASGLLFNAIFQITGTTLPGGIKIDYQSGCTATSTTDKCVTITNGTISPVVEATRNAGFDNSITATLPYATLSTSSTNLGASLAGAPTHALPPVTYTATAQNGFDTSGSSTLTLAVSFNGTGAKPTASLSPSSIDLTGVPSQTFTQTGSVSSTVKAGRYNATVTATYMSTDTTTFTVSSLSAAYSLAVNVTDFVLTINPTSVTLPPASSQPVTVSISPKAGFNTLVKLGLTIPPATASAGLGGAYSSSTISGGSGSSTLTITTTTGAVAGTYTITVTSNSTLGTFTKIHTTILTIKVSGFTVSATAASTFTGGTATSTITVTYINGFSGTVTLTNNTITNFSCTTLAPTPNSVTGNGTATISCTSSVVGTYHLSIIGTSGSVVRSTLANFTFTAGFSLSATSPSHAVGSFINSTITVTYVSGFSGTVNLTNSTLANLTCKHSAPTPSSFTGSGTAIVTCDSNAIGAYPLIITAMSGSVSVTTTATFTFTTPFAIVASSPSSQNLGTAETSTITVSLFNGFAGTVSLTNNTVTNLVCQTISQSSVTSNGTATISCLSNVPGSYVLTITARSSISGSFSATGMATFTFAALTHDVAITGTPTISPSGQVNIGSPITVTFTVQNKSPATEQVTLSLLVGTLTVDSKNVTLTGNQSQSFTLNWDTTGYGANTYTLTVQVQLPAGETNTESNSQVLAKQAGSSTLQSTAASPLIDNTTLAIIAVIIVAAVLLGTLLLLRRRRATSTTAQPGTL